MKHYVIIEPELCIFIMKKYLPFLALLILNLKLSTFNIFAQGVGINDDGAMPVDGAILDVKSTSGGMLIPRMTEAQRDAISPDTQSMLIYQTNNDSGFYYYDGTTWNPFLVGGSAANSGWSTKGNLGTTSGTNFIGTIDSIDWVIKTNNNEKMRITGNGNVGIGTDTPTHLLQVGSASAPSDGIQQGIMVVDDDGAFIRIRRDGTNEYYLEADPTYAGSRLNFKPQNLSNPSTMTIEATGVGIGTEDPVVPFEILSTNAVLMLRDSTEAISENARLTFNTGPEGEVDGDDNRIASIRAIIIDADPNPLKGALEFRVNRGDNTDPVMYLNEDGNTGIGITTPNTQLHVATGGNKDVSIQVQDDLDDGDGKYGIIAAGHIDNDEQPLGLIGGISDGANTIVNIGGGFDSTNAATDIRFYTALNQNTVAGSERMRIDTVGNVGIGTTTPSQKLHINGHALVWDVFSTQGQFDLWNSFGGGISIVGSNSNVGIATVSPNAALQVGGTVSAVRNLQVTTNGVILGRFDDNSAPDMFTLHNRAITAANHGIDMAFGLNRSSGAAINSGLIRIAAEQDYSTAANRDSYMAFHTTENGTMAEKVRITSAGDVGIGTTPTETLDVNGTARIRSIGSTAGSPLYYVAGTGVLSTSASDRRLKKNISSMDNTLEKVMKLRSVSYNWKSNPKSTYKDFGFIAQEVESIFPEVVFTNPTDGYMGINYDRFISILTKSIQQQQQIIESQKSEIQALKEHDAKSDSNYEDLKSEVEILKSIINQTGKK